MDIHNVTRLNENRSCRGSYPDTITTF